MSRPSVVESDAAYWAGLWCGDCLYGVVEDPPCCTLPEPDESIHWVADAPTSLHGNGAASFARTTGDAREVTCKLCTSLLARPDTDGAGSGS